MKTFLDEIAEKIIDSKKDFDSIKIVVPSRRAALYLKNALGRQIQKPIFAPEIVSIENFVEELSGFKKVTAVDTLFELYATYKDITSEKDRDSFDQFLGWAPLILSDFNEMDAHLVDSKMFFDFQFSYHEMSQWTKNESQVKLLQNHLNFWRLMPALYEGFGQRLQKKQKGTLGLIFREAVENLEFYTNENQKHHFFVGFNALNQSESNIIQEFISRNKGTVYWDIDQYIFEDKTHAGGKFIRQYHKAWKSLRTQKTSFEVNYAKPKNITFVGVSKNVAQAKYAAQLANELAADHPDQKTAVVLGNESLLTPTISAIGESNEGWNVTMGYPLHNTTAVDFFEQLFQLHLNSKGGFVLYKDLKSLLSTPWCFSLLKFYHADFESQLNDIESKNLYRIQQNMLWPPMDSNAISKCFFGPVDDLGDFIERLIVICDHFIKFLSQKEARSALLSLSYYKNIKVLLNRLLDMQKAHSAIENLSLLLLVFRTLIKAEKIDFIGEPLDGIQIMGLLETRLLDFENVVITNLNEGILPGGKKNNSFLPFDLKKKFNLPTFIENDAIYTYHFYRLIQRAKRVFLLYNTESDGLNSGEMSRFLYQLKYLKHPQHKITEKKLVLNYSTPKTAARSIEKTSRIQQRLREIGKKGFSPSSLALFLRNPLDFYYQKVLKIRERKPVESTINNRDRGNLVHEVLELLYTPFKNQILTPQDFDKMKTELLPLMEKSYQSIYHGTQQKTGRNHIIFEVLKKSILDFLTSEQKLVSQGNQIQILHLEQKFEKEIEVPGLNFPIKLIGIVDRIDLFNDTLRIIDYKTGMVQPKQLKLSDWNIFYEDDNYAYLFQILLYAWVQKPLLDRHPKATAGIISFRNLPQYFMPFSSNQGTDDALRGQTFGHFESVLLEVISDIFNPELNFTEKK